ncbi:hypothetical protein M8R21_32270 [Klebsiella sp. T2.Ur]|nr:hypothetical protein [Klebsiella sp. T2.Ur]
MKAKFTIEPPAPVTSTTELKPVTRIQRIIDIVAPYAEDFSVSKGEVLRYSYNNKRVCYLLHEGHTTLYRRGDGMVLNSEQAPFIMGVSNMKARQEHLYGRATSDVKLSRIPSETFHSPDRKRKLVGRFVLLHSLHGRQGLSALHHDFAAICVRNHKVSSG